MVFTVVNRYAIHALELPSEDQYSYGSTLLETFYLLNYEAETWERMIATISPYNPSASAKIRIKTIPTNSFGCWPLARTPASPTIPIAMPAPKELSPQASPLARWAYPR